MKYIENYEGLYSITKDGNVWSHYRGKFLKQKKTRGYLMVTLQKEGKIKYYLVHRLVSLTYILNKDNKPCVNHKNGNKTDNRMVNLEWVTYKENYSHAIENNLMKNPVGETNSNAKYDWDFINKLRVESKTRGKRDSLWKKHNMKRVTYDKIIHNKSWHDPLFIPLCVKGVKYA